jgi:hypothetical protein
MPLLAGACKALYGGLHCSGCATRCCCIGSGMCPAGWLHALAFTAQGCCGLASAAAPARLIYILISSTKQDAPDNQQRRCHDALVIANNT